MRPVLIVTLLIVSPATAQETVFNFEGYRIAHYRAPVHRSPAGVGRIALEAAAQLRPGNDAIFIDVLPAEGGHREADGRWRLSKPHVSIPGARWFPEVGRGALPPGMADWFARGMRRIMRGRRDRMLVLFCRADCWMGWNAAKRLQAMGYTNVWWLAEGTDGWNDLRRPLSHVEPDGGIAP